MLPFVKHLKLNFCAAALAHKDIVPSMESFSVVALSPSLAKGTPESMGEDTVHSIREAGAGPEESGSVTECDTESG